MHFSEATLLLTIVLRCGIETFSKLRKTMKNLLKKITQSSTVILISLSVVYGSVYAQQACCSTIVDACIPTFNRISNYTNNNSCRTSPSHHRNPRLQPIHYSEYFPADCDAKNICCGTDRCDRYNQGTYFNPSFPQYAYPLHKNVSSFDVSDGKQRASETYSLSTPFKAVPIYILTQSIII